MESAYGLRSRVAGIVQRLNQLGVRSQQAWLPKINYAHWWSHLFDIPGQEVMGIRPRRVGAVTSSHVESAYHPDTPAAASNRHRTPTRRSRA